MAVTEIGQMRSTAILQKSIQLQDNAGGFYDNWETVCTFRCKLSQSSGNRVLEAMQPQVSRSFKLECRAQAAILNNIQFGCRILIKGEAYTVDSFELVDQIKHWYVIRLNKENG